MSRQKIAAGNWKMNTTLEEGKALSEELCGFEFQTDQISILGVPATHLHAINKIVRGKNNRLYTAAQNCHHEPSGAYTGEISADMIKAIGVDYVILGHSERREYFGETDELIARKIDLCLERGLKVIFCCGEKLDVRSKGEQDSYVNRQVEASLFHLSDEDMKNIIIAYEPVWAIGTGETASPEQAQAMHKNIREHLATRFSSDVTDHISILYGGSVKPNNAKEIFSQSDVDGGLVGGASLSAESFLEIYKAL